MKLPSGEITRRPLTGFFLATLIGVLVATWAWPSSTLKSLEATTWAARVRMTSHPSPHTQDIVLVLVTQDDLDWARKEMEWQWPWPRTAYGTLVDFFRRGGAKAVGFDILFTEYSKWGVMDDEEFARAMRDHGNVWLAMQPMAGEDRLPVDRLRVAAKGVGHVVANFDTDEGYLLRVMPSKDGWPILGMATGGLEAPKDDVWLINYRGPSSVYRQINATEVIRSEAILREGGVPSLNPGLMQGKIVLVGFQAQGLMDLRPTPFESLAPGITVHATALDNALTGDHLKESPTWVRPMISALAALLAACVTLLRGKSQELLFGCLTLLLPAGAGSLAVELGWWIPVVAPTSAALSAFLGGVVWNYATEGRQRRLLKTAFSQYLSPEIVRRLADNPEELKLGGEMRELTMFFSDLKGFSTFSEKMDPQTLTRFLNGFLTEMTGIILAEGGTLDKYVGDAIIAFWNAPIGQEDHAQRAVRAALRCHARIRELNPGYKKEFGVELLLRVGLNTASVVVGNMGSLQRFSYTMFGDGANLASRLEGANKGFGTKLMVSESTAGALKGTFVLRELGLIRVPGRSQAVRVFEPLDPARAGDPLFSLYAKALESLRAGNVAAARDLFASIGDDAPSKVYLERCAEILSGKLLAWDGVWDLKEK